MTWLVLASQLRCTMCWVVGEVLVVVTPSPLKLNVPGEERFGLNKETVAGAGPATLGLNQTWKVTDWLGEREKPGERSEYPKPAPATVTPCNVRLISPVFWSVTFCVLVFVRARLPKLIEAGVITKFANAVSPLPASDTEFGPDAALLVTLNAADALPATVGEKATVYAALFP